MFEFVEPQLHIGHNENVARLRVFVDQDRPAFRLLGLDLFQDPLSLEHDGEDITGVRVRRVVLRQKAPQKIFRVFFRQRLRRRGRRRLVARLPKRKGPDIFVPLRPGFFAQIFAAKAFAFAEEQRVKLFARLQKPVAVRAQASARCLIGHSFASGFIARTRVLPQRDSSLGGSRLVAR